jgi:magnesium transporter
MLTIHPRSSTTDDSTPTLEGAVWIDLLDPTEAEIEAVRRHTGMRAPTREQLSEVESSSRLRLVGDALYLSTPLLSGAGASTAELSPVGFLLNPKALVTVRFAAFAAFDGVAEALDDGERPEPAAVFIRLLEAVVDRAADLLEHVGAEVERLSHSAFGLAEARGKSRAGGTRLRLMLARVGRLGQRLSQIRGVLLGVGRIVPFASGVGQPCIPAPLRHRLEVVGQDVASLDDYEGHLADKLQFLLDAVLGLINAEQNDLFKILTIVSVVGVPPTLVASVYGMNFKHMPELDWAWGYPFGLAMIAVSTLLPILWFKWRRWW